MLDPGPRPRTKLKDPVPAWCQNPKTSWNPKNLFYHNKKVEHVFFSTRQFLFFIRFSSTFSLQSRSKTIWDKGMVLHHLELSATFFFFLSNFTRYLRYSGFKIFGWIVVNFKISFSWRTLWLSVISQHRKPAFLKLSGVKLGLRVVLSKRVYQKCWFLQFEVLDFAKLMVSPIVILYPPCM